MIATLAEQKKRRAQTVPREMETTTFALVGYSTGQGLHNLIWDFHSLPAGALPFSQHALNIS